jgi:hypothetical protein
MVVCASCGGPGELEVTIAHELTHLVFNENTENSYHQPPRWLNEGIATYLSEGYGSNYSSVVNAAAASDTLIPLEGISAQFPSPFDEFFLAYGEAVAAVDYFVNTYSDETLWDLVRSYSDGVSDDAAFTAATGADMAAFNSAWTASLSSDVQEPVGPAPAPPGPVPSAWSGGQQPAPPPSSGSGDSVGGVLLGVVVFAIVIAVMVGLVFVIQRNRDRRPPQGPSPYGQPPYGQPPAGPPQY